MGCPDGGQVHSAPAGGQEEVFPRIVHAAKSAQLRLLAVTSATSPFGQNLLRCSAVPRRADPYWLSLSERGRARSKEKRVSQQLCTYAQNCRTGGVGAVPAPSLPDFRARLVSSGIRQRPPRGAIPPHRDSCHLDFLLFLLLPSAPCGGPCSSGGGNQVDDCI